MGLSTDASGQLFAFHAPSAIGLALFVGRDDAYVVFSPQVESWACHLARPGVLSLIEVSGESRTVKVSRVQIEPIGDQSEYLDVTVETSDLIEAAPEERILAFTDVGPLPGVRAQTESTARFVDTSGSEVAMLDGLHPVPSAFADDGVGLVKVPVGGPIKEYKLVGPDLAPYANIA